MTNATTPALYTYVPERNIGVRTFVLGDEIDTYVIEGNTIISVWEGETHPQRLVTIRGTRGEIEPQAQHDKVVEDVRAGTYSK